MLQNKLLWSKKNLNYLALLHRKSFYSNDYFGLNGLNSKDIAGKFTMSEASLSKLKHKLKLFTSSLGKKFDNQEIFHTTSFGSIRYDRENKTKYHGQYDEDNKNLKNFFRQEILNQDIHQESVTHNGDSQVIFQNIGSNLPNDSAIAEKEDEKTFQALNEINNFNDVYCFNEQDKQFFKEKYCSRESSTSDFANTLPKNKFYFTSDWEKFCQAFEDEKKKIKLSQKFDEKVTIFEGVNENSPFKNVDDMFQELELLKKFSEKNNQQKADVTEKPCGLSESLELKIPKTAFEYIQQIKSGQRIAETPKLKKQVELQFKSVASDINLKNFNPSGLKRDSFGYQNYSNQVLNLSQLRREELVWYIKKRVVFNENELIAIDKPYGLKCHGSGKDEQTVCLEDILPDLASLLSRKTGQLYLVHRLDRNTTGVLLMAKNKLLLSSLQSLFAKHKIGKYYWAITRGIPEPKAGIIDIPIDQGSINGKERMVLRPELDNKYNSTMRIGENAKAAITYYKLLSQSGNAGLVEVRPEQGFKHQIRVHLGFGLRTPILGDHKYSYLDKLVPQKLPSDMLLKLQVRQSKVRNLPMHLHCKLLVIPEIAKRGKNIFIKADLPVHMRKNMKSLGLNSEKSKVKISEVL